MAVSHHDATPFTSEGLVHHLRGRSRATPGADDPDAPADTLLSPLLAAELAALDKNQRSAAVHPGHLAILASPDSGKTRTLVARVGYLLATTSSHRGVAAITYTDATAREVSSRLSQLGLSPGRRLASRTVHAFCLHHILQPYGAVAGHPLPADFQVLDNPEAVWRRALAAAGILLDQRGVRGELPILTTLRRRLAAGEDTTDFTSRHHVAVDEYERRLTEDHLTDFEQMTQLALKILRDCPPAREQLAARFPHLVVDEYQDLGPVLHAIVLELLHTGVTVCAVGDPDQTMYEFQGASPQYLRDLADRRDFHLIPLTLNYRSGSVLVAAGRAALGAAAATGMTLEGPTLDSSRSAPSTATWTRMLNAPCTWRRAYSSVARPPKTSRSCIPDRPTCTTTSPGR